VHAWVEQVEGGGGVGGMDGEAKEYRGIITNKYYRKG
jgi:hypothetical protein